MSQKGISAAAAARTHPCSVLVEGQAWQKQLCRTQDPEDALGKPSQAPMALGGGGGTARLSGSAHWEMERGSRWVW